MGLQMSQSVLISHHNAHTALLKWHRQALASLTSHPPTPSDGATPSEEDGIYGLSMLPSHFSISPQPSTSMTPLPIPLFPSPQFLGQSMLAAVTLRTSRMFDDVIQPGMLELGWLNILLTQRTIQRYNTTTDIAMEEDHPVAGPLLAAHRGGEHNVMRSMIEPGGGALSERGGSPQATGLLGVRQAMASRPRLLIPQTIQSPASQTEASEVDAGESLAMAVDGQSDQSQERQLQEGLLWNTII